MQDCWRRIGCAELFIATMNPASLHLIILLNYYQSSPTVTFIWSCFHLPQKTFVDIILILSVCHNMPISFFFLYIIFVFLFNIEIHCILQTYFFTLKTSCSEKKKKTTYQYFTSADEGIISKYFLKSRQKRLIYWTLYAFRLN